MSLVCGWGINDANYTVHPVGEPRCPIYRCWKDMIMWCYSPKYQANRPNYIGCRVDERWRSFMAFRAWHLEWDLEPGDQLDKDFLGDGKLYSPETCCFVSRWLNNLFNDHGAKQGTQPQGVYYNKRAQKYMTQISRKGKRIYLGLFDTPGEASAAYLKAKAAYVEDLLSEFPQSPRLAAAIRRKMTELIQQEEVLCKT